MKPNTPADLLIDTKTFAGLGENLGQVAQALMLIDGRTLSGIAPEARAQLAEPVALPACEQDAPHTVPTQRWKEASAAMPVFAGPLTSHTLPLGFRAGALPAAAESVATASSETAGASIAASKLAAPPTLQDEPAVSSVARGAQSAAALAQVSVLRAPESGPRPPKTSPFRENAVRARNAEPLDVSLPEITSSRWAALLFLCSLVGVSLGVAYFGRVEVTSIAPGAVVVAGGPRPVVSQAAGVITALLVASGDNVTAGQAIAHLDATELQARRQRAETQLQLVRAENERRGANQTRLFELVSSALRKKRSLLVQRAGLKQDARAARQDQVGKINTLAREGAIAESEAVSVRDLARSAREDYLVIGQQIADIDLELSDREKALTEDVESRRRQLNEAEASLSEATALIELSTVRAPVAGKVESLLVTRGQVAATGAVLARIIPAGATTSIVVFAPAKDAAFLTTGLTAYVEFASLPVSEFGKAPAQVLRVSNDVASAEETALVLGAAASEPVIRVELELTPGKTLESVEARLRSGERVTARLNTRKRRIITLVFDFLRKWYPT